MFDIESRTPVRDLIFHILIFLKLVEASRKTHNLPSANLRSPSHTIVRRPPTIADCRIPSQTIALRRIPSLTAFLSRYRPFLRPREKVSLKCWIRILSLRRMRAKREQRVHFILRQPKNTPDLTIGGTVVIAKSLCQIHFLSLAQLLEAADVIGRPDIFP